MVRQKKLQYLNFSIKIVNCDPFTAQMIKYLITSSYMRCKYILYNLPYFFFKFILNFIFALTCEKVVQKESATQVVLQHYTVLQIIYCI